MNHLNALTRSPELAQAVPPEVKLTFLGNVIEAAVPLFENKNPTNPLPPDEDPGTDTTT